jgi:predicted component of type VI protein secretion system
VCWTLFCAGAGELIHSLLAQEQAAAMDALDGEQPEQPDLQKELIQRIKL